MDNSRHSRHSRGHGSSGHHRSKKQSNMAFEMAKERKKKIWLRSLFISIFVLAVLGLVVMIFNMSGADNEPAGIGAFNRKETVEQLNNEIDELKKENMTLEYELEKYKEKYGELE